MERSKSEEKNSIFSRLQKSPLWKKIWKHRVYYLFLLPGIIWFAIFLYFPMAGNVVAFKDFNFVDGIFGSDWAGLKYFRQFFDFYQSGPIIRNTVVISGLKLLIGFPMPIILALMLNEVSNKKFKKSVQTISYLPHFVSWVVVVTLLQRLFTPDGGPVNELIALLGFERINFLNETSYFYQVVVSSEIWKTVGFNSIIYLAAINGIDPQLYEAAKLDGANKFQQIIYITLPSIVPLMVIMFILSVGNILSAGYEQLLLLYSPATASLGSVLDVHVVQQGLEQGRLSYATAVGLMQGAVGMILISITNAISRKVTENSLW